MVEFNPPENFTFDKLMELPDSNGSSDTESRQNLWQMWRNSIIEMKSALQKELPATSVIKWDAGPESVAAGQ